MRDVLTVRPAVSDLVFRLYSQPVPVLADAVIAARSVEWHQARLTLRITATGHIIAWDDHTRHFTEIITTLDAFTPGSPRLSQVFQGERRGKLEENGICYQTGLQVEFLPAEVFTQIHDDLVASEGKGFLHRFDPHHRIGLTPLAFIAVEYLKTGVSIAAFHTFPGELALIKTQSLIESA